MRLQRQPKALMTGMLVVVVERGMRGAAALLQLALMTTTCGQVYTVA
jgi:hypothetical protein